MKENLSGMTKDNFAPTAIEKIPSAEQKEYCCELMKNYLEGNCKTCIK